MNNGPEDKNIKEDSSQKKLFSKLFSRGERDKEFMTDLNQEWGNLSQKGRVRFLLGALVGLILFLLSLMLVYFVMAAIIN